jgi:hypothetical protein
MENDVVVVKALCRIEMAFFFDDSEQQCAIFYSISGVCDDGDRLAQYLPAAVFRSDF